MKKRFTIATLSTLLLFLSGCEDKALGQQQELILAAEVGRQERVRQLIEDGVALDCRDLCNWTPLMKASLNGHTQIARELLEKGADSSLADKGGYTALMLAASNNHPQIVELLARYGADINHHEATKGWTALIWAAKRGHVETVIQLLALGADPEQRDMQNMTALDWAMKQRRQNVIPLLVR